MIEYCREQGAQFYSKDIMKRATESGNLELCQYLHAQQCPLSRRSTTAAVANDHADILHWLLEQGCPLNTDAVCTIAGKRGSVSVLECLAQHRRLSVKQLTLMLNVAGARGNLAAAKWLRDHGAEWPPILRYTDTLGDHTMWSGATLAWAVEQGAVCYSLLNSTCVQSGSACAVLVYYRFSSHVE
jgi:hypothetical protein